MKTLQEQYNLIKEGQGNKNVFLKQALRQFPQYVSNITSFDNAVGILKQKQVLSENFIALEPIQSNTTKKENFETAFANYLAEEAKAVEKKVSKEVEEAEERGYDYKDKENIDNIYGEEFLQGYYTELKDPKNADKTVAELKDIVAKNLAKDELYYTTDAQFGIKGIGYTDEAPGLKASETDQMVPVKENEEVEGKVIEEGKSKADVKMAEIEKAGKITTLEAQIEALEEIIESKKQRVEMISEDEDLAELMDKKKIKAIQKEIKILEKKRDKMSKMYEKMCGKSKPELVDEMDAESWDEKNGASLEVAPDLSLQK